MPRPLILTITHAAQVAQFAGIDAAYDAWRADVASVCDTQLAAAYEREREWERRLILSEDLAPYKSGSYSVAGWLGLYEVCSYTIGELKQELADLESGLWLLNDEQEREPRVAALRQLLGMPDSVVDFTRGCPTCGAGKPKRRLVAALAGPGLFDIAGEGVTNV